MKRIHLFTVVLACGLLASSAPSSAQDATAPAAPGSNWFEGNASLMLLGHDDVSSSKFEEYREVPKGVSMPLFSLQGSQGGKDFAIFGQNISKSDQRYFGYAAVGWFGVTYDYNQIPHNMGYDGRAIFAESAPGVWTLSQTLRQQLQTATENRLPTSTRTHDFYSALLAPTLASAGTVDVSSVRKRGAFDVSLVEDRPFDVIVSYMREVKSGYTGLAGGNIRGLVNPSYEVAGPLDAVNQDFGLRVPFNFKLGNVYATFNRNLYNNRAEALTIDNPFQAVDAPVVAGVGGPASDRIILAPDNEASTGTAGFLLKFARQTRLGGGLARSTRTQDASFYPYTANTAVLHPTGVPAASLSVLPQASFNGKVNTTMWNFTFSSRPIPGLGLRAQYRSYDLTDKSDRWVSTGDMSVPHQNWNTVTPTAASPYGRLTANPYDTTTKRFNASASYDIGDLTLEGAFHVADLTRTYREAESGTDKGYALTAIYRRNEWMSLRARFGDSTRTAEGETVYGFSADEAERDMQNTSLQLEITPASSVGVTFTYQRRNVDFPNRPDRVQVTGGLPAPGAAPIPGTPSGLLEANYDSFTVELNHAPNERIDLGAYYTYDKDTSTNRWYTTTGAALANSLEYAGSNEGDTFGVNAAFQIIPDKWTFLFNAMHQKVDGLMDITALESGSFYTPGRTTLIPPGQGGAADITDWDDTKLTTITAQLDYAVAEAWTMEFGYWYEKYDFKDAFSSTDLLMPQSVYIFLKPDDGAYTANVVYARLSYRF